jgi:uncharacterized protein (DUF2252 family)
MDPLTVWYARLDAQTLIDTAPDEDARQLRTRMTRKARTRIIDHLFPRIAAQTGGQYHFVDQPPLIFHVDTNGTEHAGSIQGLKGYRQSLSDERRVLLDRYRLADLAAKGVGIGSVGTRCVVALFVSAEDHPLILQVKEAGRSVLEPYTDPSVYENQGERVVMGQRLMQSSSDIFLGWTEGRYGHDAYVRQLRDMKLSVPMEGVKAAQLERYAAICGSTLARAHAKSGDPATISGYLGKGTQFDEAIGAFAVAYAHQTEQDYAALVEAERTGRIQALFESEDES